ncbi:hypothetical protein THAOC_17933, partial [Thalassiosira oceanica]
MRSRTLAHRRRRADGSAVGAPRPGPPPAKRQAVGPRGGDDFDPLLAYSVMRAVGLVREESPGGGGGGGKASPVTPDAPPPSSASSSDADGRTAALARTLGLEGLLCLGSVADALAAAGRGEEEEAGSGPPSDVVPAEVEGLAEEGQGGEEGEGGQASGEEVGQGRARQRAGGTDGPGSFGVRRGKRAGRPGRDTGRRRGERGRGRRRGGFGSGAQGGRREAQAAVSVAAQGEREAPPPSRDAEVAGRAVLAIRAIRGGLPQPAAR